MHHFLILVDNHSKNVYPIRLTFLNKYVFIDNMLKLADNNIDCKLQFSGDNYEGAYCNLCQNKDSVLELANKKHPKR